MRLKITHTTSYRFEHPVAYGLQQLRLTPKSRPGHIVLSWDTQIEGGYKQLSFDDEHANHVDLISFVDQQDAISVTSIGEVETTDNGGVVGKQSGYVPLWCFARQTSLTRPGPTVRTIAKAANDEDAIARMHRLMAIIADRVSYQTGNTVADTSAEEAALSGHGVCQDHAHIMISAARHMGFPARYVSGYLMMNDRVDQDASHAWAEVYLDGIGWIGFDPSNRICPDARYVRVATALDYRGAAPVRGMRFGQGREDMLVMLQVQQ